MSGFSKTGQLDAEIADTLKDHGDALPLLVPTTRQVLAGAGLSGGGPLSGDVALSISAFTGCVSKSVNPGSQLYPKNSITTLATYDVGVGGVLVPTGFQLPAAATATLRPQIVFEFSDGTLAVRNNFNTGAVMGDGMQGCANILMNDAQTGQAVQNDGKRLRKIRFEVQNTDVNNDQTADFGLFRVNAYAFPRGSGSLTVT